VPFNSGKDVEVGVEEFKGIGALDFRDVEREIGEGDEGGEGRL